MDDRKEAERYLSMIWGDTLDDNWYHLYTLPQKRTTWMNGSVLPASFPLDRSVYMGMGTVKKKMSATERVSYETCKGIIGFSLDVDIDIPGHHSGKHRLPSPSKAVEIVKAIPIPPTLLIHSGGGLYPQWIFKELWTFDAEAEKQQAAKLAKQWALYVKKIASDMGGYHIDSTHDLARIYRIPGSVNAKVPTSLKPVRIIEEIGTRYVPGDFEELASGIIVQHRQTRHTSDDNFVLNPEALAPAQKLSALMDNDQDFLRTWNHKRKDGPFKEAQDCSVYDFALCVRFLQVGWSDQEIVDALVEHRRRWEEGEKAQKVMRYDYYRITLGEAKARISDQEAIREISYQNIQTQSDSTDVSAPAAQPERNTLEDISSILGVAISRVYQLDLEDPEFFVTLGNGADVKIGKDITDQSMFRSKIAAKSHTLLQRRKGAQWDIIAQALLHACEVVNVGEEGSDVGNMLGMLTSYLSDSSVQDERNAEALAEGLPFRDSGWVYWTLDNLRTWLKIRDDKFTRKELTALFRRMGAEPCEEYYNLGKVRQKKRMWKIEEKFLHG